MITVAYCLQVPHPPLLQQTHVRQSKGHLSVRDHLHQWRMQNIQSGGRHTMAFKACLSREGMAPGKFRHSDRASGDWVWLARLVTSKTNTWHITSCWYCYTATVSLHGSIHTMQIRILKNISAQRSDLILRHQAISACSCWLIETIFITNRRKYVPRAGYSFLIRPRCLDAWKADASQMSTVRRRNIIKRKSPVEPVEPVDKFRYQK